MLIIEYRIVLPLTVEEFERGYRYTLYKISKEESKGEQGVETLASNTFEEEGRTGVFTHSLYRFGDRLPKWVGKVAPQNALCVEEKTWNSYPTARTVITNPFFAKMEVITLTKNFDNELELENVHGLPPEVLAQRQVVYIDIANDQPAPRDYKPERDPRLYHSEKTGRGPLLQGWQENTRPIMCSYKLVTAKADYWGIQGKVESLLHKGHSDLFLLNHKGAFTLIDEWHDMTLKDVEELEKSLTDKKPSPNERRSVTENGNNGSAENHKPGFNHSSENEEYNRRFSNRNSDSDDEDDNSFMDAVEEWDISAIPSRAGMQESSDDNSSARSSATQMPQFPQCSLCNDGSIIAVSSSSNLSSESSNQEKSASNQDSDAISLSNSTSIVVLCNMCDELFCEAHYKAWHVTQRLKLHTYRSAASESLSMHSPPISRQSRAFSVSIPSAMGDLDECALGIALIRAGIAILDRYSTTSSAIPLHCSKFSRSKCGWKIGVAFDPNLTAASPPRAAASPPRAAASSQAAVSEGSCSAAYLSELRNIDWNSAKGSAAMTDLNGLISQLTLCNPAALQHHERLSFWLNVYNALTIHAHGQRGAPPGPVAYHRLAQSSYSIAGYTFSLNELEHSVLRAHGNPPDIFGSSLLLSSKFKSDDPRKTMILLRWEPLVTFGMCCGANSSPPIKVFSPQSVHGELWTCAHSYLERHVAVVGKNIAVPKMLSWWARDFGGKWKEVFAFVNSCLSQETRESLAATIGKRKVRKLIDVQSYDWSSRFRFFLEIEPMNRAS